MRKSLYHILTTFLSTFLLWEVCFCPMLHAQEHLNRNMLMLHNINTEQGLSSARVYSFVQAEDGAMWISTKRGVDRYKGQVVRNYVLSTVKPYSDLPVPTSLQEIPLYYKRCVLSNKHKH